MTIFISNFARRLGDFLHQNRGRLIRLILIVAAALIVAGLIYYGVERWHAWRFEKRAQALEGQIRDAEGKAKEAEGRADVIQRALEIRYAYQHELEKRAETAEAKLRDTKARVVTLKEQYETIRYVPVAGPVSCESACAELVAAGYKCR